MRLKDKTAIVTGASSGIGRAIALLFAREGANVIAADISEKVVEGGDPVIQELRAISNRARFLKVDVASSAGVDEMVASVVRDFGRLDILINNAAIHGATPLAETEEGDWDRVMAVNLKGPYLCSRAAVRQMMTQEIVDEVRGRIVNITSQHGMISAPGDFAYGVSKAGLVYMTRQIAADYAAHHIVCNAVAPGKIMTGKPGRAAEPAIMDYSRRRTPSPRLGEPTDVAKAALYLASAEASYITGHNLLVDGGWMAA